MHDLPLVSLRAFALVYEHRGVRAAARELGIAHSSVSRHLGELSRWVGVPLVRKSPSRGTLLFTPQGEALGRAALLGLQEIHRIAVSLREAKSHRSVSVAAAPSFAARWLLPRLPSFSEAHPRIDLSVIAEQQLRDPDGRDVDLAIRMGRGPWPGVACEPLMDDAIYPVMSPALWRKTSRPSRAGDLKRVRLLHDRDPQTSWETWRRANGPALLDVRKGLRFTSSDLVLRAAAHGQGVALGRHRLAREDIVSGALIRPLGDAQIDLGISYWIVLPEGRRPGPAAAAVLSWLKSQAAPDK